MTRSRKIPRALHACGCCTGLLLLATMVCLVPARASGMPVFDATNWAESIAQLQQLQQQLQTQQKLTGISERGHAQHAIDNRSYQGQRSLRNQQPLREEDHDVSQRCSASRAPSQALRQACSLWVRAQNRRYNTAVQLQQQLQQREQQWLEMLNERNQLESEQSGLLQSHIGRMSEFQSQLQIDLHFSQTLIQAHDQYVDAVQQSYIQQLRSYFHGQTTRNALAREAQLLLLQASLKLAADKRR